MLATVATSGMAGSPPTAGTRPYVQSRKDLTISGFSASHVLSHPAQYAVESPRTRRLAIRPSAKQLAATCSMRAIRILIKGTVSRVQLSMKDALYPREKGLTEHFCIKGSRKPRSDSPMWPALPNSPSAPSKMTRYARRFHRTMPQKGAESRLMK